jgi:hypothetical protein
VDNALTAGTYAQSARVDVSRVGERAVLYHRDSREALVLNVTGSWLWECLSTAQTEEQLTSALQAQYRLSVEQASRDVQRFLSDLRQHDAIISH